jgi:hypothetical protein
MTTVSQLPEIRTASFIQEVGVETKLAEILRGCCLGAPLQGGRGIMFKQMGRVLLAVAATMLLASTGWSQGDCIKTGGGTLRVVLSGRRFPRGPNRVGGSNGVSNLGRNSTAASWNGSWYPAWCGLRGRRLAVHADRHRVAAVTLHSNPGMTDVCFQQISGL